MRAQVAVRRRALLAVASAALVVWSLTLPLPPVARLLVVGGFLVSGPGLVLVVGEDVRALGPVVVVAASVAVDVLVSQAVLYTGRWSGTGALLVLVGLVLVLGTARFALAHRRILRTARARADWSTTLTSPPVHVR